MQCNCISLAVLGGTPCSNSLLLCRTLERRSFNSRTTASGCTTPSLIVRTVSSLPKAFLYIVDSRPTTELFWSGRARCSEHCHLILKTSQGDPRQIPGYGSITFRYCD